MKSYDLDDKTGLFGTFMTKNPTKLLRIGDDVEFKHFALFNLIKAFPVEVNENSIKIQAKEAVAAPNIKPGDHVVVNFTSGEMYVLSGEIESVDKLDPLEVTIKINKIEKMKDFRKGEKFAVSLSASIKIIGIAESVPAVAKNISFGGAKINCKEEIMQEDVVEITITIDKSTRYGFKGRVVRKNKVTDYFEYGLEITEITETNLKNLHHLINQFQFA